MEDGEYEPIDPQPPHPQSQAPNVMKTNVACGDVQH